MSHLEDPPIPPIPYRRHISNLCLVISTHERGLVDFLSKIPGVSVRLGKIAPVPPGRHRFRGYFLLRSGRPYSWQITRFCTCVTQSSLITRRLVISALYPCPPATIYKGDRDQNGGLWGSLVFGHTTPHNTICQNSTIPGACMCPRRNKP